MKEALRGLRMIYASKPPKLVPLREMVDAIRVMRGTEKAIGEGRCLRYWGAEQPRPGRHTCSPNGSLPVAPHLPGARIVKVGPGWALRWQAVA